MQTLLSRINHEMKRNVVHIGKDVMDAFEAYPWPGNIRELENALMKAVALSSGDSLTLDLFDEAIQTSTPSGAATGNGRQIGSAPMALAEMEHRYVSDVLASIGGHKGKACEVLGISRPRLRRILREEENGTGDPGD